MFLEILLFGYKSDILIKKIFNIFLIYIMVFIKINN